MTQTIEKLEQENADLRAAVAERLAAEAADDDNPQQIVDEPAAVPVDWILRGEAALKAEQRQTGDGVMAAPPDHADTPAEQLLIKALGVVRDRRPKYGGPREHFRRTIGMINAAFAEVLKRPLTEADWALIMTLDKVARYLGPTKTADQITDLAGYAACLAEVEQP